MKTWKVVVISIASFILGAVLGITYVVNVFLY